MGLIGAKFPKTNFQSKFQYSNSKNQTKNKRVCHLKFGFEIYLEIGLWKFGGIDPTSELLNPKHPTFTPPNEPPLKTPTGFRHQPRVPRTLGLSICQSLDPDRVAEAPRSPTSCSPPSVLPAAFHGDGSSKTSSLIAPYRLISMKDPSFRSKR